MSEPRAVFSRALSGCHELQRAFPSDPRLRRVIEQLQFWVDRDGAPVETPARHASGMSRIDARSLKPLNENVAGWVYDAAAAARRLMVPPLAAAVARPQ